MSEHPEHAQLIGQIVAQWNVIEDVAAKFLSIFISADQFAVSQLFASFQSRGRLDFLRTAGRRFLRSSTLLAEFESLANAWDARLEARNRYAHGIYATDEAKRLVLMRRKFELTKPDRAESVLELSELITEWQAVIETFNRTTRFYEKIMNSLSPEHQTLLLQSWSFQSPDMRPPAKGVRATCKECGFDLENRMPAISHRPVGMICPGCGASLPVEPELPGST